mmetsp:Transcript_8948/g.24193  ORF Transcript_8948/g.24193 Transcript_8948/m.24193 type:complete len:344 (+) Transcript_8948:289-1320(+)
MLLPDPEGNLVMSHGILEGALSIVHGTQPVMRLGCAKIFRPQHRLADGDGALELILRIVKFVIFIVQSAHVETRGRGLQMLLSVQMNSGGQRLSVGHFGSGDVILAQQELRYLIARLRRLGMILAQQAVADAQRLAEIFQCQPLIAFDDVDVADALVGVGDKRMILGNDADQDAHRFLVLAQRNIGGLFGLQFDGGNAIHGDGSGWMVLSMDALANGENVLVALQRCTVVVSVFVGMAQLFKRIRHSDIGFAQLIDEDRDGLADGLDAILGGRLAFGFSHLDHRRRAVRMVRGALHILSNLQRFAVVLFCLDVVLLTIFQITQTRHGFCDGRVRLSQRGFPNG